MRRELALGPSSDSEILILASLANGPKHGYAVLQDIERFSNAKLRPGTLYTAITRLVDRGKISPEGSADSQRPYRITDEGLASLSEELKKMQEIDRLGMRRLKFS